MHNIKTNSYNNVLKIVNQNYGDLKASKIEDEEPAYALLLSLVKRYSSRNATIEESNTHFKIIVSH